ncbi:MBL fold metallo-hydrolase [Dactylosporangium sp. CS-047395]|uniref:MBL fold metallo-hydrolase n=1 Tax=Dactylosporangium sp. CS-047395 TaxID=3239936 RepID=UPI003D8B8EC4
MQLGDVEVTQVPEWEGDLAPVRVFLPDCPPELWRDNADWLVPDFWTPATDGFHAVLRTWVLRSAGRVVLVDTGVGDDRDRPQFPLFSGLRTGFLERLAAAGVAPEDVDVVVNTHIHIDHVGWNTHRAGGAWVPTFPNATYLIPRIDQVYFQHRDSSANIYADSIAPVLGQAVLWEDGHRIDENLALEPAPGHTPGASLVRLASGADRAVFVGDLLHSPVQIMRPRYSSCFDENPQQAAATRRRVLERAADERELVVPAHFAGAGAAEVSRAGSDFAITRWA